MASSIFGIGITGLNTARAGLLTTSHNISNVNTPGYSRQTVIQGTNTPQFTGFGFFGTGAHVQTVQRQYNAFLEVQARETQASASHLERYTAQISRLDQLLSDLSSGLSSTIDTFFEGVNEVASYPRDPAARQSMLSGANALAARFQALDAELASAKRDVHSQLESNISAINSIATRIAELNERIGVITAQGNGMQQPNDLLDQRDTLVRELNQLIGARVVEQNDGSYNVFIGNGQALVVRNQANSLSLVEDLNVPGEKQVAFNAGGTQIRLQSGQLTGGELGGLLEFRDQTLYPAHNALGRIAMTLAAEFNAQHRLGQDLNRLMGGDFFSVAQPQIYPDDGGIDLAITNYGKLTTSDYRLSYDGAVYTLTRLPEKTSVTITQGAEVDGMTFNDLSGMAAGDSYIIQPTRAGAARFATLVHDTASIAAASPIKTSASLANTGNATISAGSVDANFAQDGATYTVRFAVAADGTTTYTVERDGAPPTVLATGNYDAASEITDRTYTFAGITVQITGKPGDGDSFAVVPNDGDTDNRNALALAAVQTKNVMEGGTATVQSGYARLVASIGNKTRELQITSEAQTNILKETLAARESVSGVNLDEEAANLLRYQQAYQASGKVIAVASTLFDSILEIMR